jgi:cell division protein ZapE
MLSTTSPTSFRAHYLELVTSGAIEADPAQARAADAFAALEDRLSSYKPRRKQSLLGRLFADKDEPPPRGLYVHGEVGRGKTMLMDLFFQQSAIEHKRRAHFHEFMAEVHERIYGYRQDIARGEIADGDVIALTANAIFDQAWLLCFDEFHVTDIADAMILGRLFTKLFELGTVVVATSNVAPDDLYKGGLNRALFLPFIAQISDHMDVLRLDARTDFRLEKLAGVKMWLVPADDAAGARYRNQGPHPAGALFVARRRPLYLCRTLRAAAGCVGLSSAGARLSHHPRRPHSCHGLRRAQRRQAFHLADRYAL